MAPLNAQKMKGIAKELSPILLVLDRIYRRDPERFHRLIVWLKWAQKEAWPYELIFLALQALDKKELEDARRNAPSTERLVDWWPYLYTVMRRIRTKRLQAEGEQYKEYEPNSVSSIFQKILENAVNRKQTTGGKEQ